MKLYIALVAAALVALAGGSAPAQAGGCNQVTCQVKVAAFQPYDFNAGGTGWVIQGEGRGWYEDVGEPLLGHVKVYGYSWTVFGSIGLFGIPATTLEDVLGPQPWPIPVIYEPYLTRPYSGAYFAGPYPCRRIDADPSMRVSYVSTC
jgi:hypothetical protein